MRKVLKIQIPTKQVYNGPRTSNLSQQQFKKIWSKIIFEQNQKIFPEQNFGKNKILEKKIQFFFSTSSIIPGAHPVQISSRSDYCIILS